MSPDYKTRIEGLRRLMHDRGVGALLVSVGADLPYFTGYEAMPLERLTMLVVTADRDPVLVVPELEAPRVEVFPEVFQVRSWGETEDPVEIVARHLMGVESAAVGDQTWSVFLLALQNRLPGTRFTSAALLTRELRMRKDPAEIDALRRAARAADRVTEQLGGLILRGRTEIELARLVAEMTLSEGHETASFAIVASGPNGASPHHEASDRVIEEGDAIVVDFGGRLGGYCSDTTRTFYVGEPSDEFRLAYSVLEEAQAAAVEAVRPGAVAADIDGVARRIISRAGFGDLFIHRTGHGIGLETHEHPYIVESNDLTLEPGMTFSVEPGIYLPGRFGMRIEDIVAVTTTGVERLNRADRGLTVVV